MVSAQGSESIDSPIVINSGTGGIRNHLAKANEDVVAPDPGFLLYPH